MNLVIHVCASHLALYYKCQIQYCMRMSDCDRYVVLKQFINATAVKICK